VCADKLLYKHENDPSQDLELESAGDAIYSLGGPNSKTNDEAHLVVRNVGGWIAHRQNRALLNGVAPWIELDLEVAGKPCALPCPLPHIFLLLLRPVKYDVGKDHCLIWRRQPGNAQRHLHEMNISSIHEVQRLYSMLACASLTVHSYCSHHLTEII